MEYDLKALQNKEIEILKFIADACDKLQIQYFIFYGSLLGAIRHKGFIPWDDDMDICMMREDYERFLKEGQKYLPENLLIQHYTTEIETNNLFIKVRDKNTLFLEQDNRDLDICHGIFVDIFPIDRISDKPSIQKKEFKRRIFFDKVICCYSKTAISTIVSLPKRILSTIVHYTFCKLYPKYKLMKKEDIRRKKVNEKGENFYLRDSQYDRGCGNIVEIAETQKYTFGGEEFFGPKNYDMVLTALYGDYMQLPPEEKRRTHKPLEIKI